jgi:hypothetical protein
MLRWCRGGGGAEPSCTCWRAARLGPGRGAEQRVMCALPGAAVAQIASVRRAAAQHLGLLGTHVERSHLASTAVRPQEKRCSRLNVQMRAVAGSACNWRSLAVCLRQARRRVMRPRGQPVAASGCIAAPDPAPAARSYGRSISRSRLDEASPPASLVSRQRRARFAARCPLSRSAARSKAAPCDVCGGASGAVPCSAASCPCACWTRACSHADKGATAA